MAGIFWRQILMRLQQFFQNPSLFPLSNGSCILEFVEVLRGTDDLTIQNRKSQAVCIEAQSSLYTHLNVFGPYKSTNEQKGTSCFENRVLSQVYLAKVGDGLPVWVFVLVYIPDFLSNDIVRKFSARISFCFFSQILSLPLLFSLHYGFRCSCFLHA